MVRAATPTPGTAPVTWRCTRYVALHLLRGAAPDQNGCIAYRSGAPPTPTSPNADTHTSPRTGHAPPTTATHYLDRHCATYSPAQRPPHLAQHSHSQTQPRRASQPHRAPHPQQGTAPVTWRCTRSERVHCLRIGCIAYGSGAAPTFTSPNADTHTSTRTGHAPPTTATHYLDRHCATYSPAQRPPHLAQHSHSQTQPRRASQPHRAPHPQQGTAPVMWRCTSYVALHPIRTGALPTDRVQRPHSQAQPRRASGSPQPTPRHRPHIHQFRT